MKLTRLSIKNFKSVKEIEFEFPESGILILVGENNSGKSNIIRAIDAISGEGWYGKDKLEDHDFYLRNRANQIDVTLTFDNNRLVRFRPTSSDWGVKYYTSLAQSNTMPFGSSIKEDFPCTYLGADRTFDKHLAFYDWTLIGRIRKAFHRRITPEQNVAIQNQFETLVQHFDHVAGFAQFKNDFTAYFSELLPLTATKIGITFKPFTPANLFKSMQILALDEDQNNNPIDVDELGEGARNIILISLLRKKNDAKERYNPLQKFNTRIFKLIMTMITREELLQSPEYWFENAQNDLYGQVIEYMEKEGINQTQLAEKLGVSKGYISQILKGEFNYTLKKLIELGLAIGQVPKIEYFSIHKVLEDDQKTEYLSMSTLPFISGNLPLNEFRDFIKGSDTIIESNSNLNKVA